MFQTNFGHKVKKTPRIQEFILFFPEKRAVYEVMSVNTVGPDRP
jgi:hypothetical protein